MNHSQGIDHEAFHFSYPICFVVYRPAKIEAGMVVIDESTEVLVGGHPDQQVFMAAFTERLLAEQFVSALAITDSVVMAEAFHPHEISRILDIQSRRIGKEVGIAFDPAGRFPGFRVSRSDFDRYSQG